jgi:two-component system OmpR family sensor kinase
VSATTATERLRAAWATVPLRTRLVGISVALLVIALVVTGWSVQFVLKGYLAGQVDHRLVSTAKALDRPGPVGKRWPSDYYVLFLYDSGATPDPYAPPGLTQADLPVLPQLSQAQAAERGQVPFTVRSAGSDLTWRVVAVPVDYVAGGSGTVVLALPLQGVEAAVDRLRLLVFLFGIVVTGVCAILAWLAIRRAFAPLTAVERTAAAIAAGDLSKRVPAYPPSTEVGRLTSALNGMLAQIEAAFRARQASEQRTRRFAADASHELRTPLAAIRGYAELYRQGAVSDPEDVTRTMGRIEHEARRMGVLVEDLLLLARLDEQRPARTDPVDLAVLAGDAVHDARGLAPDRTVRLVGVRPGGGPEPSVVVGDENRLRQVVANLLGNAVRHTPEGSPIEVAVGRDGPVAVLEVRDHGAGIPPGHAEKVFERFYRVDSSRARHQGGGSGLGLSIVAAVASAHGGRVGVAETPGGGATFRLELPAIDVPADDAPEDDVPEIDVPEIDVPEIDVPAAGAPVGDAPTAPVRTGAPGDREHGHNG